MGPGSGNEVTLKFNTDNRQGIQGIRQMSDELGNFGKSSDGLKFNLSSLGQEIFKSMGSFGAFAITANSVLGVIGELGHMVGGVIDTFVGFADTIANVVVGALRMAGDEIANLTEQVFELNKSTEQSTGAWRFIFGGGGAHGAAVSQDLMNWTSQFSMQVPYTRQDLMGAITALGRAGLNEQQVKDYMGDIADLGALNPQRNLTQAAWSIQGAMHGYSRMLKYDYGINPEDLYKYGYDENNAEQTLLPALRQYLMARGLHGVSQWSAKNTFWGAESSFVDRLQNFGLEVGGTNLAGTVDKGSMFGVMKQDLTGLSDWWDKHGKQIGQVADLLKNVLGGAVKDLTAGFQGLATGLHASGLDTLLTQILDNFGKWLNSPGTQAGLKEFGDAFGRLAGTGIATALEAAGSFFEALGKTGVPQALFNGLINLFNTTGDFFKNHKKDLDDFFSMMGKQTGETFKQLGDAFKQMGQGLNDIKKSLTPEEREYIKWFLEASWAGAWVSLKVVIEGVGLAFKLVADQVARAIDLINQFNNLIGVHPHAPGGSNGGGTDPGAQRHMAYSPGSYTANNATSLHFYGAGMAQVAAVTNRLLDERDRGSYLARRTPGGFSSLGILG